MILDPYDIPRLWPVRVREDDVRLVPADLMKRPRNADRLLVAHQINFDVGRFALHEQEIAGDFVLRCWSCFHCFACQNLPSYSRVIGHVENVVSLSLLQNLILTIYLDDVIARESWQTTRRSRSQIQRVAVLVTSSHRCYLSSVFV